MKMVELNSADQFTLMLDYALQQDGLLGNYCMLALELEAKLNLAELNTRLQDLASKLFLTNAKLIQKNNKYIWQSNSESMCKVKQYVCPKQQDLAAFSQTILTRLLSDSTTLTQSPIEVHVIESQENNIFILRWYHPLTDAKGAELLARAILGKQDLDLIVINESAPKYTGYLNKIQTWPQYITNIYRSLMHIRQLNKIKTHQICNNSATQSQMQYQVLHFDSIASLRINQLAVKYMGITGIALYYIAGIMRAFYAVNPDFINQGFCVPYAVNMRKAKAPAPIFGNQLSFLFAQADHATIANREALFSHLKSQNKMTISKKLDLAFRSVMHLAKKLSLKRYAKLVRKQPNGNERAAFWFSYTGEMNTQDLPAIKNMFQLSPVTRQPSIAFLVSQLNQEINISICYHKNDFSESMLNAIKHNLHQELLGESCI